LSGARGLESRGRRTRKRVAKEPGGRGSARGDAFEQRVAGLRRFNRFYTREIGVLNERLLRPFSLSEARVLYELAQSTQATATDVRSALRLDAGYLSRILGGFERRGLIRRTRSTTDGRQSHLRVTARGRKAFSSLDARSRREISTILHRLRPGQQQRLLHATQAIQELLGAPFETPTPPTPPAPPTPYTLRRHQPGDMGWVVHRHGVLYAEEYGWDERCEALAARVVADFVEHFNPARERCWIAEREGESVGCVFLMEHRDNPEVARLRLLLVEPSARGLGIGHRLVGECTRFGEQAGYRKITLWTNSVLHAARRIYERAGYRLVQEEPHHSFGRDLVGQTWELDLPASRSD